MLFVLISLAATALIGTPVLARMIKNTIRESEEYKGKKREETSSNKGEAVDDEMINLISSDLLLENEPNLHSNEFNDVISYENSLVSIRWNESHSQTHTPPPAPKPKKEPVQSTSSAPIKPSPVTPPAPPPPSLS